MDDMEDILEEYIEAYRTVKEFTEGLTTAKHLERLRGASEWHRSMLSEDVLAML